MDFENLKMQVLIKVLRFVQASYLKFIRMRLVLSQDKALIGASKGYLTIK